MFSAVRNCSLHRRPACGRQCSQPKTTLGKCHRNHDDLFHHSRIIIRLSPVISPGITLGSPKQISNSAWAVGQTLRVVACSSKQKTARQDLSSRNAYLACNEEVLKARKTSLFPSGPPLVRNFVFHFNNRSGQPPIRPEPRCPLLHPRLADLARVASFRYADFGGRTGRARSNENRSTEAGSSLFLWHRPFARRIILRESGNKCLAPGFLPGY